MVTIGRNEWSLILSIRNCWGYDKFLFGILFFFVPLRAADALVQLHSAFEVIAGQKVVPVGPEEEGKKEKEGGGYTARIELPLILDARFNPRDKSIIAVATSRAGRLDYEEPCDIHIYKHENGAWKKKVALESGSDIAGKDIFLPMWRTPFHDSSGNYPFQNKGRIVWNSEGSAIVVLHGKPTKIGGFTIWSLTKDFKETSRAEMSFESEALHRPLLAWKGEWLVVDHENEAALLQYKVDKGLGPLKQSEGNYKVEPMRSLLFLDSNHIISAYVRITFGYQANATIFEITKDGLQAQPVNIGPGSVPEQIFVLAPLLHGKLKYVPVACVRRGNPQEILLGEYWPISNNFTFEKQKTGESANALHATSAQNPVTSVCGYVNEKGVTTVAATYQPKDRHDLFHMNIWQNDTTQWKKYNTGPLRAETVDISNDGEHLLVVSLPRDGKGNPKPGGTSVSIISVAELLKYPAKEL